MVVKVYLTLKLDKDDYPVPADGDPSQEIQQALEEFIYDIDGLKVKSITIGDDFRFAAKRAGTLDDLYFGGKKYGFSVNVIPPVYKNNQRVSSTFIRDALAKGDLETAKNMLERDYSMSGRVIYGQVLGKKLGFPTANINLNRMRTPIDGIFAVRVGGINQGLLNGVASIGSRPTIGGKKKLLEVYIFYQFQIQLKFLITMFTHQ